jgi:hypothetical protein
MRAERERERERERECVSESSVSAAKEEVTHPGTKP